MTRRFLLSMAAVASQLRAQPQMFPQVQSFSPGQMRDAIEITASVMTSDGKVVKGAPYSAEAVTETIQTLSDGNRIVHTSSTLQYRDGEGRTRREMVRPDPSDESVPAVASIKDPVAQVEWVLDSRFKRAHKMFTDTAARDRMRAEMTARVESIKKQAGTHADDKALMATVREGIAAASARSTRSVSMPEPESLGTQNVEGILAEGTRTTIVAPAGAIGNDREIVTYTERWYSPELQTVIMTKWSDPRQGETTYRLTNLRRGEPAPLLFQVPQDYTITQDQPMPVRAAESSRQ